MSETPKKVIKLKKPVTVAGETTTELQLREPLAADLFDLPMQNAKLSDLANVVCMISGKTIAVIRALSAEDFSECIGVVTDFL